MPLSLELIATLDSHLAENAARCWVERRRRYAAAEAVHRRKEDVALVPVLETRLLQLLRELLVRLPHEELVIGPGASRVLGGLYWLSACS